MMRSLLVLALFAFSASVYAEGLNYNSITASYGQIDFDGIDADGDSLGLDGSFEITDSFFLFAGYSKSDVSNSVVSVDVDSWGAGVGFHMPVSDSVDFVTSVSYEYVDVSGPLGVSVDDNGYGLGVGLRYAASEKMELNGNISYVDFGDGGDDTSIGAAFLYNFTKSFSVGVAADFGDDATSYGIGGRFYFGN